MAQLPFSQSDLDASGTLTDKPAPLAGGKLNFSQGDYKDDTPQEPDWENMPTSEVLHRALQNAIPSFESGIAAVPNAIYHYDRTGQVISAIGKGLYSKFTGMLGAPQDPQQKAADEAPLDNLTEPYAQLLNPNGPHGALKKAFAEDPFSVLSTLSLPLGGGEFAAAKMLGEGSKIGSTLNIAQKALNPSALAASAAMYGAGTLAPKAMAVSTGRSPETYQTAASAGTPTMLGGPGAAEKKAFSDFQSGQGNALDFSKAVKNAMGNIKNKTFSAWANDKDMMLRNNPGDVDPTNALNAIQQARMSLGSPSSAVDLSPFDALNKAEEGVWAHIMHPDPAERGIEGWDRLKRDLYNVAQQQPTNTSANVINSVHAAVKDTLEQQAPDYARLMDAYQSNLDNINTLTKGIGAGPNIPATTEIAKSAKLMRDGNGDFLIGQLADEDPRIPYMIAGHDLSDGFAGGRAGKFEGTSMVVHGINLFNHIVNGSSPREIAIAASLPAIQALAQSPRVAGGFSKAAGFVSPGAKAAAAAMPAAGAAASSINQQHGWQPITGQDTWIPRAGHAKGGAVKDNHERLVNRLLSMAEQAKRQQKSETKSILNVPDNTVTTALAKANEAI